MNTHEHNTSITRLFVEQNHHFSFKKTYDNGTTVQADIFFLSETFIDYQKDLINDFLAVINDDINDEDIGIKDLKKIFEQELQELNTKLTVFAEKIDSVDYFPVKWMITIIADDAFMASMVGDVSLLIVRDQKIYYSLANDIDTKAPIDLFSDFIEGEMEHDDQTIFIGMNHRDLFDEDEIKKINEVLTSTDTDILSFITEIIQQRTEKENACALIQETYDLHIPTKHTKSLLSHRRSKKRKWWLGGWSGNWLMDERKIKQFVLGHKYQLTLGFFWLIIIFLVYSLISWITETDSSLPQFSTWSGTIIVTISDIEKEIEYFQNLDPTSNEKWRVYQSVMEKLFFLESKWRRTEDVTNLKKLVQNSYYEWFNIIYVNDFETVNKSDFQFLYPFSSVEQQTLWSPVSVHFERNLMVGWSQGAILGGVNEKIKGTALSYNIDNDINNCDFDLSRTWLYCHTNKSLYRITNGGIEEVQVEWWSLISPIIDVGTYAKNNLYLLTDNAGLNNDNVYMSRYRNQVGSYTEFQAWLNYELIQSSGSAIQWSLSDFSIDGSFVARSSQEKKLYQFRRDASSVNQLNKRIIPIQWGDTLEWWYSSNVKVITLENSTYVYLFDRDNQTFTVYRSSPLKNNDKYQYSYNLLYLFRIKFDLGDFAIVDATVPETTGNKPQLYLVNNEGVYQVNLFEFIEQYTNQ